MKVSFKIAECSLFGAKINKKHETHKRFRTFYMFLSIHCVEFLHLVMEHRSIVKTIPPFFRNMAYSKFSTQDSPCYCSIGIRISSR